MKKLIGMAALAASALLVACGGGGGSPGNTDLPYSISVRAAKSQLPINISNQPPGIGAYARYTTTLYVEAREGGAPIPGGEDIFGCAIVQGLDSGALYYLDGDKSHEDDNGNPLAYRSITLDSNSGANSFHLHAGTKAGTVRITCSVTNPVDKQISSASVDVVVGAATGQPASVVGTAQAPGFLGTSNNIASLRNNVGIQAFVMDDANQPIPEPAAANLQVSIRSFGASTGARLLSGSQSGSVVQVRTIGGVGLVSLSSGSDAGVILLELTTDRADNNVSNGIQDAVTQLMAVSVHKQISAGPLAIKDTTLKVANGIPFSYAMTGEGGVPPYSWTASGLPNGLSMSPDGVISGTANDRGGVYNVVVTMTDDSNLPGNKVTKNIELTLEGNMQLEFALNGCSADVNVACALPAATVGQPYVYILSVTGGDPAEAVTWTTTPSPVAGLPNWNPPLSVTANGVLTGTPLAPASGNTYTFVVTAKRGDFIISRQVSIRVN
ncbi:MAG: Ig domain-containing protein [Burkholderiaceae bacterium]|nr:Ig domain-containing protein [Burkholderiaceae bacterium]